MKLHDYTGAIYFHSSFAVDGHIGLNEIINTTCKNVIDFLIMKDHDHLRARHDG
jgi:hypothetical protein